MVMSKKRIVIADDHSVIRQGLHLILGGLEDYEIVAEAHDGIEAIDAVEGLHPDLVLVDLSMPRMDGFEATARIKKAHPEIKVIVLTIHDDEHYMAKAFEMGADAYVIKNASKDKLIQAIERVFSTETVAGSAGSMAEGDDAAQGISFSGQSSSWATLTEREREILKLIAKGQTAIDIAAELSISIKTVETHRSNIMHKLSLNNSAQLTAYAIKKRLL